jgi:hypothetical protein
LSSTSIPDLNTVKASRRPVLSVAVEWSRVSFDLTQAYIPSLRHLE